MMLLLAKPAIESVEIFLGTNYLRDSASDKMARLSGEEIHKLVIELYYHELVAVVVDNGILIACAKYVVTTLDSKTE